MSTDSEGFASSEPRTNDTLVQGISRDLRRMLAVIASGLTTLDQERQTHQGTALAQGMRQAIINAGRLVEDIEGLVGETSGAGKLVDVKSIIREVADIADAAQPGGVRVLAEVDSGIWPVRASSQGMKFALTKLVANAVQASGEEGTITLIASNIVSDGGRPDHVRIEVIDQGAGIAPEAMGRVFEPFFTTPARARKAGLGLTHVLRFAQQFGGSVSLTSSRNKGTRVTLTLPLAPQRTEVFAQSPLSAIAHGEIGIMKRLSKVDDR